MISVSQADRAVLRLSFSFSRQLDLSNACSYRLISGVVNDASSLQKECVLVFTCTFVEIRCEAFA